MRTLVMTGMSDIFLKKLDPCGDARRFFAALERNRRHIRTLARYGGTPYPFVRDTHTARRYLAEAYTNEQRHEFGVWKDDALLGMAGISLLVADRAEVYYWTDLAHRGKGLATAAVGALVTFAFGFMGMHALEGIVKCGNVASERVLEHNRFTRLHADEQCSFYCRTREKGAVV